MARYSFLAAGCVLIVAVALIQGSMTERWSPDASNELQALVGQYKSVPMKLGDWVGEDNKETKSSQAQMKAAHAHAFISRKYHNPKTGETVGVFLICGFARDIAVHTPDVCYIGQGFTMEKNPQPYRIPTGVSDSTMLASVFKKQTGAGLIRQRIYWAWNGGSGWAVPSFPRVTYPARTPLNKVYLISDVGDNDVTLAKSAATRFAELFLPELSKIIYPPRS